jgi:putative transposase
MLEQSDEWAVSRRYFSLESLAGLANTDARKLPAVAA